MKKKNHKMNVLLLEPVYNLGQPGDVVLVNPGYYRNYLCKTKAVQMNSTLLMLRNKLLKKREEAATAFIETIKSVLSIYEDPDQALVFYELTHNDGELYGSITADQIAKKLSTDQCTLSPDMIDLDTPIKVIGTYKVKLKIKNVQQYITVKVRSSTV